MAEDLRLETGVDPDGREDQQCILIQGYPSYGRFHRLQISFPADEGEPLVIEMGFLAAEHWDGPLVIGWKAGLEAIAFALDPSQDVERFYFRPL